MCGLWAARAPKGRTLAAGHPPDVRHPGEGGGYRGDTARDAPPIFPPFGGRQGGLWPSMGPDGADGSL